MTTKDQKSRDAVIRRSMARLMAKSIAVVQELQQRRLSTKELDRELRKAFAVWTICISSYLDDPAKFLHMVANALEGKLRGPKLDDAIKQAFREAVDAGYRRAERPNRFRPFLSEVDSRLAVVLTKIGYDGKPTKDGLRRRAEILGYRLSHKAGAPRKKQITTARKRSSRGK